MLKQLEKDREVLEKGGMNVDVAIASVDLVVEDARNANANQESLKHQLRNSTKITEAKMDTAYDVVSSTIDMMAGAVRKTSPEAKVYQRLRSRMRQRGEQTVADVLPVPVPEATE